MAIDDHLLTAVTTEHFGLVGARSQAASESATRSSLYLGTLSSALIAPGARRPGRRRPAAAAHLRVDHPADPLRGRSAWPGLRSAALSGVTGIEETAVRALATLEQMLPSRLRHRVRTLGSAIFPMSTSAGTTDVDALLAVAAAVRDHQRLRVDYRRHDGSESRRTLEPHRIVHAGRRWYLVAWDVDRADWRTFRLDRLTPRTPPGPRFEPREAPEPDLAAWTSRGISTEVYRYRCRITVHAPADVVGDRVAPTVGVVTPLDRTSCALVAGGNSHGAHRLRLVPAGGARGAHC